MTRKQNTEMTIKGDYTPDLDSDQPLSPLLLNGGTISSHFYQKKAVTLKSPLFNLSKNGDMADICEW